MTKHTLTSMPPAHLPEMVQLGDKIKSLQEQAAIINDNLTGLNARLFGTGEASGQKNVPTPVPSGAFGYLFQELENLQTIINRLGETSARLYSIA